MIKIFAKKAFLLKNPADLNETKVTKVQDFDEVPEWAKNDDTFKMAVAAGDIQVMGSKKDERAAEKKVKA